MRINLLILMLFLVSLSGFGQAGEKLVRCKVVADSVSVAGINVVNLINEKSAVSNVNGEFSILAKADDLLILQSENFEYTRRLIETDDLKKDIVLIKMIPKPVPLREVIVKHKSVPDDLTKRHSDHRDFTPAERKLYTATTGPVDILVNAISGRTKMLKKELNVEMNERLLARVGTIYEDDYYIQTLKIPQDYIKGFQYYIIEDAGFVAALRAKNKTLMRFETARLAEEYKKLIGSE